MAIEISVAELQAAIDLDKSLLILDVRRAPAFEEAADMLAHATWHDPAQVDQWGARLDRHRSVVVYYIHGHQVVKAMQTPCPGWA